MKSKAELLTQGGIYVKKNDENERVIALAGNPNVGKSTVFNSLTGMKQHTGNWAGKTVSNAQGKTVHNGKNYILVDLPGTYSLMANSKEEEAARDFICFSNADCVVIVCDATCVERNLNLVLQTLEITKNIVVCINLTDEAERKNIFVSIEKLSENLGLPVVSTSARSGKGMKELMDKAAAASNKNANENEYTPICIRYIMPIEEACLIVENALKNAELENIPKRFAALRLLEGDNYFLESLKKYKKIDILENPDFLNLRNELKRAQNLLLEQGINKENINDKIVSCLVLTAEGCCDGVVSCSHCKINGRDRKLDKILTSRLTGIPIMLLLLAFVFWLTITGANYPSQLLSTALFWVQDRLSEFFLWINAPLWLNGILIEGIYRTLAWVVAVMLPPMAIFFPLFTLLEDFGYLPRVAFNLDSKFKKANACGKQSLTMCMGFGCNAVGVTGCRIIDSPRERLIAIITNSFVPCNGRFPTLIAIITMFFVGMTANPLNSLWATAILTLFIMLGVALTFIVSRALSVTVLKGEASSFALELPPYRKPQFLQVIVRSIFDRTLFVLSRAIIVAAPAGMIIWLMGNIFVGDISLLAHCSSFLDPFAQYLGLDGVILLAFILGFPANEIVLPIIIMAYMSTGSILELDNLMLLKTLLIDNGWTWITAVSTMLFCLIHWPCSTTCLTIAKETGSTKWTVLSFLLPTIIGLTICFLFNAAVQLCNF